MAPDTLIPQLVEILAPRLDDVIVRSARRAKREIAVYESIPELEIREGIGRDLSLAMRALMEGREATAEERESMGIIGDKRARQGLPLESMLRVYRITISELFEEVWTAGADGVVDHGSVVELTRAMWQLGDAAMETAVSAYRHRELELASADNERRSALLHALLFTPAGAPDSMIVDTGLDPEGDYVAVLARAGSDRSDRLLSDLRMPGVLEEGIVGVHGQDIVGFARDGLRMVPAAGVVIGVGPAVRLSELPRSLSVARRVVDAAVASGIDGVLRIDDVALHAIARSEDTLVERLVERFIVPVPAEILDTVRAYLDHGLSTEAAAAALEVHGNTVRNRLHRFETVTRASLTSVDDLLLVRLALLRAAEA